ncbi:sulfatase [Acidobacteriota bacterium]
MKTLNLPAFVLLALLLCGGCQTSNVPETPPNVVVILIDSLRADSLNDYGNERNTNPFLTEFGQKGIRFTNAHSHSSETKISVATLFTGLLPPTNGVRESALPESAKSGRYLSDSLSSGLNTLAEVLQQKRYRTAAFSTNPHIRSFTGFSQGFDDFQYHPWPRVSAKRVNDNVFNWISKVGDSPFFMYIHYMDVHSPYRPPLDYRFLYTEKKEMPYYEDDGPAHTEMSLERVDYQRARYDAQINYWDDNFKDLIEKMRTGGFLDNTVFVILSDHGEEFYEHRGFGHGYTVYEEVLHIPLYIVFEGRIPPGQLRQDFVGIIDIFPTICSLAGQDVSRLPLHGKDILSPRKNTKERFHYAETYQGHAPRSVQTERYKLILNSDTTEFELYDLQEDPMELTNSVNKQASLAREYQKRLLEIMSVRIEGIESRKKELDQKTIEQLKSLGYIK